MNIYSYLKNDHRKIEALMQALLSTDNMDERMILFDKIRSDLLLHAKIAQDNFYKDQETEIEIKKIVEEIEEDSEKIEKYLKKLAITNEALE
jgi:hypothetical protein